LTPPDTATTPPASFPPAAPPVVGRLTDASTGSPTVSPLVLPTASSPASSSRVRTMLRAIPPILMVPIVLVVALTMGVVWISETNYAEFQRGMSRLVEERTRIDLVNDMALVLLNAETAQRGYLLTGRDEYLSPLDYAKEQLPKLENRLAASLSSRPDRWEDLDRVRLSLMKKLVELETSIQLYRMGERAKALEMAGSEEGRALMDAARATIVNLSTHMNAELESNRSAWLRGLEVSRYGILGVAVLSFFLLIAVFQLLARDMHNKARLSEMIDSENARLGREVAERTHELNELTNYLQWTAEREKATIARDLHDELGGILTSAKMDIEWLGNRMDKTTDNEKRLAQLNRLVDEAVSLKRRVIEDLRPSLLDNLGLAPALEWHVSEHCKSAGLICKLDIADLSDVIDSDTSIAVYRIVQEALTNVIRHAKATRFELAVAEVDGSIELRMRDNGVGLPASFNAAKLSHGLSGMRQRARALGGDIAWESAPRQGTRIDVRIPLRARDVEPGDPVDPDAMLHESNGIAPPRARDRDAAAPSRL
jgi:signal transduction histidine kinase